MTGSTTNLEYIKQSNLLNKRTGEPQAFELLRSFGQKYLESQFWPSRRDENWRYTSTQIFSSQEFIPNLSNQNYADVSIKDLDSYSGQTLANLSQNSVNIVFVNGVYAEKMSRNDSDVRVLNIRNAVEKGLYPIFDLSKPQNNFEALNLSLFEEGVFIDFPTKAELEPTVCLTFISTQTEKPSVSLPRVVVKVNDSTKVNFFESYESANLVNSTSDSTLGSAQWTNAQVEIHLEANSKLNWARLQNEAESQLHTCRTNVYLAESSELHTLFLACGASLHRHDFKVEVRGENASVIAHGISLGTGKEHRDHNTLIDFKSGNSKAEQVFKSILHGESKSVFNGKIIIQQDSQKVDSSQLNQSLILSEKAEANSQPQLEIYADDVKATHGATIGQLSEDELFYFRSRGISEKKAKLMLTQGFAMDLIERYPHEEIRSLLRQKIVTKLKGFW